MARTLRTLLTDDLLARIHDRAPDHDRQNTFPHDDLADLVAAGYLTAFVPARLGGAGLSLEEVAREQVRLAAAAPATALAVNMHLVVTGLAALLVERGDDPSSSSSRTRRQGRSSRSATPRRATTW